jgi:hypothetical protein
MGRGPGLGVAWAKDGPTGGAETKCTAGSAVSCEERRARGVAEHVPRPGEGQELEKKEEEDRLQQQKEAEEQRIRDEAEAARREVEAAEAARRREQEEKDAAEQRHIEEQRAKELAQLQVGSGQAG